MTRIAPLAGMLKQSSVIGTRMMHAGQKQAMTKNAANDAGQTRVGRRKRKSTTTMDAATRGHPIFSGSAEHGREGGDEE